MIAQIEEAILAAVNAANFGYALGTVASYGGELEADEQAMALLLRQFPAVWVVFNTEATPKPIGTANDKWRVDTSFLVMAATRNLRGEKFTRHGVNASIEVGAYQIIEDLRLLLLGQDLNLDIARFTPGPVKSVFNKKLLNQTMAVFAMELKTSYVITKPDEANQLDWIRTGFNYYLKPGDDITDASDLITLRE